MHELSLIAALVDEVSARAAAAGGAVRRVHVRLGEIAGVDRALFETAWDGFREATACAGAELVVHAAAARWECPRCGAAVPRGAILRCAECASPARLVAGDELVLERIEMEVP